MFSEKELLSYIRNENIWLKYATCGSYKHVFDFGDFVVTSCQDEYSNNTHWIRHIIDLGLIKGHYFYSNDPEIIRLMKREESMGKILFCVLEKLYVVNEEDQLDYILEKQDVETLIEILENLRQSAFSDKFSDAIDMFAEYFPVWGNAVKSFHKQIKWFDLQVCNYGFRKENNEIVFFDIVNV